MQLAGSSMRVLIKYGLTLSINATFVKGLLICISAPLTKGFQLLVSATYPFVMDVLMQGFLNCEGRSWQ